MYALWEHHLSLRRLLSLWRRDAHCTFSQFLKRFRYGNAARSCADCTKLRSDRGIACQLGCRPALLLRKCDCGEHVMNRTNQRTPAVLGGATAAAVLSRMILRSFRPLSLRNKVVLTTARSHGLGLVLAREFVARGAHVASCARSSREATAEIFGLLQRIDYARIGARKAPPQKGKSSITRSCSRI